MPIKTSGSSQAAWALITEGVTSARVEAHRLRLLVGRAMKLVESSEQREHLYEVAGDLIQALPTRLEALEQDLDRTSYALSVMGEDHLRDRLPLSDRKVVDEAAKRSGPWLSPGLLRSSQRVAERYLKADLNPQLGWPGGPCHVINRVRQEVRNPKLREELVDDVEFGEDWSNPEAAQVYSLETEQLPTGSMAFKRLLIGPHAQYRMDLRGITVPQVRAGLRSFFGQLHKEKSQKTPRASRWEQDFAYSTPIPWDDRSLGMTVVFAAEGRDIKLVTAYWEGQGKPRPPGDGGCDA